LRLAALYLCGGPTAEDVERSYLILPGLQAGLVEAMSGKTISMVFERSDYFGPTLSFSDSMGRF
jgi:hypothetical protein